MYQLESSFGSVFGFASCVLSASLLHFFERMFLSNWFDLRLEALFFSDDVLILSFEFVNFFVQIFSIGLVNFITMSELVRKFLLWSFLKLRRRWFQKFVLRWSWWNLFSFPHHCIFLCLDYFWLRSSRSTLTLPYNIGSHYDFQFKLTNLCFLALLPKSLKSILLRKRQLAWRSLY